MGNWQDVSQFGSNVVGASVDRVTHPFPPSEAHWRVDACSGYWRVSRLGSTVYSVADFLGRSAQFDQIEMNDRITIQFLLEGQLEMFLQDGSRYRFGQDRGAIFACPQGTKIARGIPGNVRVRYVSISMSISQIATEFGIAPEHLRPELRALAAGEMKRPLALEFHLSLEHRNSLEAMLDNSFSGLLADRYREAKLSELTCLSIDWLLLVGESGKAAPYKLDRYMRSLEMAAQMLTSASDKISVSSVAREVGLNKNKLRNGFKDRFGVSPNEFSRRARMDEAAKLIAGSDKSILEIALMAGFNSQSSFTRSFREMFGMTPRDIRRRISQER